MLLGDGGVGKTSLVKRFVYSKFDDTYIKTLGTNVYKKVVKDTENKVEVRLQIWDVMGQNLFPNMIRTYMKGANGFILVCDLTNKRSFTNLQDWIYQVFQATDKSSGIVLANKSDLDETEFGVTTLEPLANALETPYYMTSAKTGDNVEDAFNTISRLIYEEKHMSAELRIDLGEKVRDIPEVIQAEEKIISTFCKNMGGYENGMPMIRQQFEQAKINFENPTWDQLQQLVQRLVTIMQMVKPEDQVKKIQNEMRRHLKTEL